MWSESRCSCKPIKSHSICAFALNCHTRVILLNAERPIAGRLEEELECVSIQCLCVHVLPCQVLGGLQTLFSFLSATTYYIEPCQVLSGLQTLFSFFSFLSGTTYNIEPCQVLSGLQRSERRLFHDRLRQLDRKILAGVSKISWASPKSTIEAYCSEALRCLISFLYCFRIWK